MPLIVRQAISSKWAKGTSGPAGDEHHNLVIADPVSANEGRTYTHEGRGNFRLHNVVEQPTLFRKAQKAHDPDDHERWEAAEQTDVLTGHGTVSAGAVVAPGSVRRLTPLECERLQGFPDGWTCLCQPMGNYGPDPDAAALACRCTDSARYRALGNAVTTTVARWLGHRLLAAVGSSA